MNPYLLAAIIILGVIALFFIVTFLITLVIFKKAFGRAKELPPNSVEIYKDYFTEMQKAVDWFEGLNPEKVSITSFDGLKLHADLLIKPNARATVILMHGYHGRAKYDFSLVLPFFYEKGFNILLPDQRAHGKSEGKYLTFGTFESVDCLYWAKYIASRFNGLPIDLHGVSMGGSTVMMTARFDDLPSEVKCITSDCGFTSPDAIISNVRKIMHLPFFPFQHYVRFLAKHVAKFDLCEVDTTKILCNNKLPLFLLHGEKDTFVPTEMSLLNNEISASENKRLLIIKDATHAMSYVLEPQTVEAAFYEFFDQVIPWNN